MTTVLATEKFIMADRRLTEDVGKPHATFTKLYVDKHKRGAYAYIGYVQFKRTKGELQAMFDALYRRFHPIAAENTDVWRQKLDKVIAVGLPNQATCILLTAGGVFTVSPMLESEDKTAPGGMVYAGTGGGIAAAFYTLGMPLENIMEAVSHLDGATSPEYDIVYTKDLMP